MMNNSIKMDSLPNLQFPTLVLMQILYQKSTYVTPNAGRPQAFRRAGAGKEKRHENPISQIARFGGDMKSRFSQILKKNTGPHGINNSILLFVLHNLSIIRTHHALKYSTQVLMRN